MEIITLTVRQLFVMLLYLLLGWGLFRCRVLTQTGSRDLAGMLVKLVIPAIIVNSFCTAFSPQRLLGLIASTGLSILLLGVAVLAARLLYPTRPLENFSAAFSNAGFMGIPLVQAVLGPEAVFYLAPFVAVLNLLQWTYGTALIREEKTSVQLRTLMWNPPVVGILIGLLLFLSGLGTRLPTVIDTPLRGICGLNAPLAMMVLGVYLAKEKPSTLFNSAALYGVSAARLVVIPLLSLGLLWLLPVPRDMALALLLCAAAPVGANVAVYAQLNGKDHAYASKMVVLSTLLSLITLPLLMALAALLL